MIQKTLIITLEFPPQIGGIATLVSAFAASLDPDKCVVLTIEHRDSHAFDARQKYHIIRKKLLLPPFIWPRWLCMVWHTWRIVRTEHIERVMIHHALPSGYAAVLIKWFMRVPFILCCHGTDIIAGSKSFWKKRLFAFVARQASVVVMSSQSLEERFTAAFPTVLTKHVVLYPSPNPYFLASPNQADVDMIKNSYGLLGKKIMLTVARIVPGKGVLTLAQQLPELIAQIPNLIWLVVGTGRELPRIEQEIEALHLQNIVRFVGDIPQERLPLFYHAADVFALITHSWQHYEEGFGLVFLEAAACGVPAVAGDSGGVSESVIHGATGLVVNPDNPDEIKEAILTLFQHPEYARALGSAAKSRVYTEFQWQHQVEKLVPWLE